jgi:hypothetical protein
VNRHVRLFENGGFLVGIAVAVVAQKQDIFDSHNGFSLRRGRRLTENREGRKQTKTQNKDGFHKISKSLFYSKLPEIRLTI